ncbi:MAG: hypothetical protein IPP88_17255 [Betaproteobacteria bacterium]|nr:hypothetical protein [Betaproteobacteria bacterium]
MSPPLWSRLLFVIGTLAMGLPAASHAESRTGTGTAGASLNFRITIPAMIRVNAMTQPDHVVIGEQHVNQGFIDLDTGTAVNLTSNNRDGYVLTTSYDSKLLSAIEVRVSSQTLKASSGTGSMRVSSGLIVNKLVPISYRLHLAPGVRAGEYRWPVALAFSLAVA